MCNGYIGCHNHLDYSNIRLLDCTNAVTDLLKKAAELSYKGLAITDHETVSGHVQAIKKTRELKEKGVLPKDFKLILGNEIYLVDDVEEVKNNYTSGITKFPHFILLSKDKIGHEQLRYLSSKAWENSFYTGTMLRVPTEKKMVEQVVKENPNHLIATTACLGSEANIHILSIQKAEQDGDKEKVKYHYRKLHEFIKWCIKVFGKHNFFVELQPAYSEEQIYCNKKLLELSKEYDLKYIVSTDTHYLRPEDRIVHKAFLNAKDGDREIDSFYEATFLQTIEEMYGRLDYLDKSIIDTALENTLLIGEMIEDYTIEHETIIPRIQLPDFKIRHLFKKAYDRCQYINKMVHSEDEQDRYLIKLIEDGFNEHIPRNTLTTKKLYEILDRIDVELGELWEISQQLNQAMSSYYITTAKIVDIIWADDDCGGNSIVGSGRGSSGGFLICFLLGITQINPLEYGIEMPHWRHLHRSRPDIGALDIDIDTEGSKRPRIIQALKKNFGEDRILQVCTFGTEGSKSAIQTACRGLGIDSDIGLHISGLIPFERGQNWSISDCLYGNEEKKRKPVNEFITEIEKYPNLKETALKIEGLINKRSIHAGGVIVFNDPYYKSNAMMKAPNGLPITQFNLEDSQAVGNIKFDLLTIEALDKIRVTLDLLLKQKEIEWKGTLRKTFNAYLHPNVIEKEDPEIYKMIGEGKVLDLFQFSTDIGLQTAMKVKPSNLLETASANSLMRLMSKDSEQPIDTFIKYKNNINLWYDELRSYNLNDEEIKVLEKHLLKLNGVADTQESVMLLSMDEKISSFDVKLANKLRKAIAKRSEKDLIEVQNLFFEKGRALGTSENLLRYVWEVQIKRQLGYAFSILHTLAYSVIALQELNLNYRYNPLYWITAVLTVNAAGTEDEEDEAFNENKDSDEDNKKNKSTNYGKVASAIGMLQRHGVKISLPDINRADFGFIPDLKNNQIIYGLKGIVGIGDEIVQLLIQNRPYKSFEDFLERMYDSSLIKKSQMLQLIKAGCFESFGDRKEIMKKFILNRIFKPKEKLTMQNFEMLVSKNWIPEEYREYVELYNFKKEVTKKVHKNLEKDKLYLVEPKYVSYLFECLPDVKVVDYFQNKPIISEKSLNKAVNKLMEGFKEWLKLDTTVKEINKKTLKEEWYNHAAGTISKWEMDSLSFYYTVHELSHVNKEKYGIVSFHELLTEPVIEGHFEIKGQKRPQFRLSGIVGTVLDRDKNKHTVTLLTPDGVVIVKYYDGEFAYYNKQISIQQSNGKKAILEKSWFTRGNKLFIYGYRRGSQFIPKKYKNSKINRTTILIKDIDRDGNLKVQQERVKI